MMTKTRLPFVVLLITLLAMPALAAPQDEEQQAQQSSAAEMELHPTNYRHRHVQRRRRAAPPRRPAQSFGDDRSGMFLGLGLLGNFFIETDSEISSVYEGGGGFNLALGARMNRFVAFELGFMAAFQTTSTGSNIENGSIQAICGDAKIYVIPDSARIEPFIQVGLGAYLLSEAFREQLTGVGLNLGGGVDIRFGGPVGLGLRLLYRGFYVDNSDRSYNAIATEAAFLNTLTAEANLQIHF